MINGIPKTSSSESQQSYTGSQTSSNKPDALASKDTFLKLLVAQIRNQDPLQPNDGIQFVTQLAQFSGLEQSMEIKDEVQAIHKLLESGTGQSTGTNGTGKS